MSKSIQSASKSSSELVVGVALTVSPSLIRPDVVELYEEENRPMVLNRSLLQSPIVSSYEFTHKAVWAVSLPQTNSTWDSIKCFTAGPALPDLEHWAFVAKGKSPGLPDIDAYFVAQFNSDSTGLLLQNPQGYLTLMRTLTAMSQLQKNEKRRKKGRCKKVPLCS